MQQLVMFQETREDRLEQEVIALKGHVDRLRKSQFARLGELEKMYFEVKEQLNTLTNSSTR